MAGSATAAVVAESLTPFLIALSVALLARSFWMIYARKRATRPVKILTWCSAVFVVVFWTWQLLRQAGWM